MIPTHNVKLNTINSCQNNKVKEMKPDKDINGNIEYCPCGGTYYDAVCDSCSSLNPEYE